MRKTTEEYSSNHSSESNRRKTVGLTIKPDLLTKARKMNLNLSKILENTLETMIEPQNNRFSLSEGSLFAKRESSMVGRTGFEPATFCTSSRCPTRLDDQPYSHFRMVFSYLSFSLFPNPKHEALMLRNA